MGEVLASTESDDLPFANSGGSGESAGVTEGARYTISRGDDFYGVWDLASAIPVFVERFPLSADGWISARRRVEMLESSRKVARNAAPITLSAPAAPAGPVTSSLSTPAPSSISPAAPSTEAVARTTVPLDARYIGAGLILVGVMLGVAGMFPAYLAGSDLTSRASDLLPHIAYVATWAFAASLLMLDRRFVRAAAGVGVGLSVMTFGFLLTDVCTAVSSHGVGAGPGLYLSIAGWVASTSGCMVAMLTVRATGNLGRSAGRGPLVALGGALGLAIAAAFALPWDRFVLTAATSGSTEAITAGNVFANPGAVITADLVVMILIFAMVLTAFAWRPVVLGATFLVGALVAPAAQVFATLVQAKPALSEFGVSAAEATANHVTLSVGYTVWFYLYCALIAIVVLMLGWIMTYTPRETSS